MRVRAPERESERERERANAGPYQRERDRWTVDMSLLPTSSERVAGKIRMAVSVGTHQYVST